MAKIAWRVIAANAARAQGQIDRKDEERGVVGWIWASIIHGVIVAHLELGKRRNLAFPHNSQVWGCEVKENMDSEAAKWKRPISQNFMV